MGNYVTLADILGKKDEDIKYMKQDSFICEKLGEVPFTAIDHKEYKQIKADCMKMIKDKTGGLRPEVDDDKMMIKLIIMAVDKDSRSDFTFANKELLAKLDAVTAEDAVQKLLYPGEIYAAAIRIQDASGFRTEQEDIETAVKNS